MSFFDEPNQLFLAPEGRVEAVAKVTGKGKYSAEYAIANMCYAVLVESTIPAGKITGFHLDEARLSSGVIDIITHLNKQTVPGLSDEAKIKDARLGFAVFHTDQVYYKGQPIAMVIAETVEEATYAASLVSADYDKYGFSVDFKNQSVIELKATGKDRGSLEAWLSAPVIVESEYRIKSQVHNPMEMHATTAHWTADDKLKLYDKSQGVMGVQRTIAKLFNLKNENVQVTSEFVGGGFGSGLRVWPHTLAAVIGAKQVKRPLKLMLTRPQMFSNVGYRPQSWQKIKLGADSNGKFLGMLHQARNITSVYENFNDGITRVSRLIYHFNNLRTESALVPMVLNTPTWMRGPGDCTGDFAVESAIDELSYQLNMDPVALRMKNLALDKHPEDGKPWSTNFVNEAIEKGASIINWKERKAKPNQTIDGDWKIGYGMAVGMWNAGRNNASAGIEMQKDGSITVKTAMTDIGTGTGASMQNMAQTGTGISKNKIKVELGNSDLPPAGSQGGSTGLSSISGAVDAACKALKLKLASYAANQHEVYKDAKAENIVLSDNGISLNTGNNEFVAYAEIWEKNKLNSVEVEASSGPGGERQKYAFCSSTAHFCKLKVHSKTGKVKIERMVCVADGGTIVSEKPAANQISGSVIGGIGMALMEEQVVDTKLGSLVGNDLAGYHFPVNADAPVIEVAFVNKPDPNINPSGAKGLGEVGIIGVAAAIANAIYNATGKRMRDLPITPDKVLME
jgi:xanthine dehydrogenase YagR molybdenum-binding subunit